LLFRGELRYTHIVLDEIHERSLEMDFCFVALKNILNQLIQNGKKTTKLVVMSATLNFEDFTDYFAVHRSDGLFFVPELTKNDVQLYPRRFANIGRNLPLADRYELTKMSEEYQQAANYEIPDQTPFKIEFRFWEKGNLYSKNDRDPRPVLTDNVIYEAVSILKKHEDAKAKGDILMFVPGFFEIQKIKSKLIEARFQEKRIVEVHSFFSDELYDKLFESDIKNKIILATSIGESSITLPDCKIVIDFCLTKRSTVNEHGINQLQTHFASKSSLTQRAGRVGRVSEGIVYRMIPKNQHDALPEF
jgi:ATP-dependent RNA helicase TDRD9